MCKLSVIVPVYKVEKFLSRCIESIINQSFSDFELILVDDGSPDNCPQICDEWAKKDSRIKVIHKENGGLSSARNAGLDIMKGEYVSFIDSDDFVHPKMFSSMISALESHGADISVCSFLKTNTPPRSTELKYTYTPLNNVESVNMLYNENSIAFITAWGKIYSAELFENIRFPIQKLHEDEFTTYKLLYNSSKIIFTNDKYYYYYVNSESIIQSAFSEKNLDALEAFRERFEYFDQRGEDFLAKQANNALISRIMYSHQRICGEKSLENKKVLKKKTLSYLEFIDQEQKKHYLSRLSLKQKLWTYAFFIYPDLYSNLRNLLKIGL